MIPRRYVHRVLASLEVNPVTALLGPRQVGKTTLARQQLEPFLSGRELIYLDLENPQDIVKLEDAIDYLTPLLNRQALIVIDEVQRMPDLFQALRSLVDQCIHNGVSAGHFLLLGSATNDLLNQSSESLAGRISYIELCTLNVLETSSEPQNKLWVRGGFPRSYLAENDEASANWRADFITTYLERDIPQLGPRIAASTLRRFWTMLAHQQGGLLNAAQISRSLGVDGKTVASYLDLMVDLLLVRKLSPLVANTKKRLVKSPKVYVRDSGLLLNLLGLDNIEQVLSHPVAGASWEGYVIENLLSVAPKRSTASFFRTATGDEIDLVVELAGGKRVAIEIKRSTAPTVSPGFYRAIEVVEPAESFVVCGGAERYRKASGVEVISLMELTQLLAEY